MNELLLSDELGRKGLIIKYGSERVEDAAIFITNAKDSSGRAVNTPVTTDRVRAVLRAVYGDVNPDTSELRKVAEV